MAYKDKKKQKEYSRNYYLKNNERIRKQSKEYSLKNKEHKKEYMKEYSLKNKERIKEYQLKNKERIKEYTNEYYLKNKECIKEYNLKNKERRKEHFKKWAEKHRNRYEKQRRETDPNHKLRHYLRSRIGSALKGKSKSATTMKLIGCTIEELWNHLESQFEPWMTRENHGLWHVDHIKACARFDLTDPAQQRECFHYTNLQPLEAIANIKKGKKIISGDITSPKM